MRIGVIGTGHVGLVTSVTLAEVGHAVTGADVDTEKISALNDRRAPFYEPGMEELLHRGIAEKTLVFSPDVKDAIAGMEVVFICVGTPPGAGGEANLIAVERAATDVARAATGRLVVAEKSTVPTGTASKVRRILVRDRPDLESDLEVVANPEFLREGQAIEDARYPTRILVGADSEWALDCMRKLYGPFVERGADLIETDIATAELAKHACNAFLALKISFANALARLSERAGADVTAVADVMGTDPRIGRAFLDAGLGYGGSCFHKDLMAFERLAARLGYEFPLLHEVARINDEAVAAAVEKISEALWNVQGKRVALFGLAFKPRTDDTRFAPALALARRLFDRGAQVVGYDPMASANAKAEVAELDIAPDPYEAASGAHCIVLCTEWDEFRGLDFDRLRGAMASPVVVDGRNFLDEQRVKDAGFSYYPTGRRPLP